MANQVVNSKEDIMRFGKYKGRAVKDIMEENAQYLLWLADVKAIVLAKELEETIIELASQQHIEYLVSKDMIEDYDIY